MFKNVNQKSTSDFVLQICPFFSENISWSISADVFIIKVEKDIMGKQK
jgi:hypothetical protein